MLVAGGIAGCTSEGGVDADTASDPVARGASTVAPALALPGAAQAGPRPVRLTAAMLRNAVHSGRLDVSLADGSRYAVQDVREQPESGGRWSVIGRVRTAVGMQSMVLTVGPDAVFGVLPRPDGGQFHITTTRGVTSIAPAGDLLPPGATVAAEPDYVVPPPPAPKGALGNESAPVPTAAQVAAVEVATATEIAVLGLYTDNLVALRGSVSAAETEVNNLFSIANQAHVDSGTGITLRVAALRQVTSDAAKGNRTVLDDITQNRIEGIDLVGLRNEFAADLVALVRPYNDNNGSCGVAWLGGANLSPNSASPAYGFSVNNIAPCSPYVLAHELGHNLGSMHDITTSTSNGVVSYGAYPFSFGYRQPGPPSFATIMAYSQSGQPRIGYFSSPGSTQCGAPCGIAEEADNVRSLRLMASRIAAFRATAGTMSIIDADAFEPDPGLWAASPQMTVRLSGIAPEGGVRFTLTFAGGTAESGVDYQAAAQATYTIPQGQSEISIGTPPLLADADIEPDETIEVRMSNVVGASVEDGLGIITIRNDDPRLPVSGRVRFPAGMTPPASGFYLRVSGLNGDGYQQGIQVLPPDFAYRMPAVPHANLSMYAESPAPYVNLPVRINGVRNPVARDLYVQRGVPVSGQLKVPAGDPMPTAALYVGLTATVNGVYQPLPYLQVAPPDFRYTAWVMPGAWVRIPVTPPAPYQPYLAVRTRVLHDVTHDIELSRLPSLVAWSTPVHNEGDAGTRGNMGLVVELSSPAPAGGVQARYQTVDGTASAGSDYVAASGALEFAAGERSKTVSIEWIGDDHIEGDEWFSIVIGNVVGAHPVSTSQTVWLKERDRVMSDPLRPSASP